MAFAYNGPAWVEIVPGRNIVIGDAASSYDTIQLWSSQMRTSRGIKTIVDDAIPDGKIAAGNSLVDRSGTPCRVWTLQDAPPPPVPFSISDRQFAQQLAVLGTITQAEAIAWAARGDLPAVLTSAIDSLPDDGTRFSAQMLLSSATTYERLHPMTATLGTMLGYDDADLDAMWRAAALL